MELQLVEDARRFLRKIVDPPLEELGGLLADQVRLFRFKKQVEILEKAQKILLDKGINPRKVSLKTLVPILEEGSLEEDESMSDRWASLLATAADPSSTISVQPSFPEVLKELSPKEALILDKIFDLVISQHLPRNRWASDGATGASVKQVLRLSNEEFEIAVDNLYRLKLCSAPSVILDFTEPSGRRFQLQTKEIICLTDFGFAFVSACHSREEEAS
jgi:hypothetical protein